MESYYFSENSYPDLPAEETYDSIRITLPNKHYDPKVGADLYNRYLDEWQAADDLGLNVMTNEHHQTPTCLQPAVALSSAILARITKNAKILVLGNPLPNRDDPVRVAEEMAVIDNVSRGRLQAGFVRSVPFEILPANSVPVDMKERLWEGVDLILKAWTTHDGPFSWEGRYHYRHVNIWPRPYQQPHPPVWMTTSSVYSVPQIAERGFVMGTFIGGYDNTRVLFEKYREVYEKTHGSPAADDRLAYAALVAVGETTEEGIERLRRMQWYFDSSKIPRHLAQPPGYVPPAGILAGARAGKPTGGPAAAKNQSAEWLVEHGLAFAGSPGDVLEQLTKFNNAVGGFGNLIMMGQAGALDHEETVKTLTLFATEVQPALNELVAA